MASPQVNDGFIQISTEFHEAICRIRIPGEARQVFDAILRKTWGWKKKSDLIALSQMVLATGLDKRTIVKARRKLVDLNLIVIAKKGEAEGCLYTINKDFDTWKPSPKKAAPPKKAMRCTPIGGQVITQKAPTKETVTKETSTKEIISADFAERLQNLISCFPLTTQPMLFEYLELLAAENRTGKILLTRKVREVNKLYQVFMGVDPPKFEEALRIACDNQAPNPNYVKAVIKGFGKKRDVKMTREARERKEALEEGRWQSDRAVATTKELIRKMDEQQALAWSPNAQRQIRSEQIEGVDGGRSVDQNGRAGHEDNSSSEKVLSDS